MARSCQQHFGTSAIHVLVNNAGNADPHMPQQAEAAAAHWRSMIDTNLTGGWVGGVAGPAARCRVAANPASCLRSSHLTCLLTQLLLPLPASPANLRCLLVVVPLVLLSAPPLPPRRRLPDVSGGAAAHAAGGRRHPPHLKQPRPPGKAGKGAAGSREARGGGAGTLRGSHQCCPLLPPCTALDLPM